MIGEQVEQYRVQKKLGNGAMGSIYLALDTTLDRAVALKFVLSDFDNHPGMARRFLEEAKVLASLNRPNIPILYGYFIWHDHGVMAMEYVDGDTFEDMIQRRGPIPANVCVPLVRQALQGLAAAHRRGIVHRDLKPGNLMLNREGTVKVVDFGIAKKIETEVKLTATNTTIGTPMYMAPEQIMGKQVDARSDIYSMGIVLYELLAGQVPFNATSLYEIQAAHVQKIPDPPTVHYPHIPKQVVDAVMKALQKNPADRFASAEDFIGALPDLEPAVIPIAPSPEPIEPHPQAFPSHPTPVPMETVIQSRETRLPAPVAPPAPVADSVAIQTTSNRNVPLLAGLAAVLILIVGAAAWFVFKPSSEKPVAILQPPANPNQAGPISPSTTDTSASTPAEQTPPEPKPSASSKEGKRKQPAAQQPTQTPAESGAEKTAKLTPPAPPVHESTPPADLSGQWQGFYFNTASKEKTSVRLSIREVDGNRILGSLDFQAPDNTTGQCDLTGSSYQGGTLRLLTHCTPKLPYFNTYTTFSGVQPTTNELSGGRVFNSTNMVASLQRN